MPSEYYFKDICQVDTRIHRCVPTLSGYAEHGYLVTEYPRIHLFLGVAFKWQDILQLS